MERKTISMPRGLWNFIDEQVERNGFSSRGAVLRHALRRYKDSGVSDIE